MQLTTVPKSEQENLISAFWALMRQAEEDARDSNSNFDKHMVEGYYKLWNRVTGDSKVPHWQQEKVKEAPKKYILLRLIGSASRGVFTLYTPENDQTKIATGEVAYEIIGFADTPQEAQIKLFGYSTCDSNN